MSEPGESSPNEPAGPQTFDQRACAFLRQAHALIFASCPEARSVASVVDYYGNLNDAQIQKGVWHSDQGEVVNADAIFGSMFQTLRLMEEQFHRAIGVGARLRQEAANLSLYNKQLLEANERLEKEIQEKLGVGSQPEGVGDGLPADEGGGGAAG